MSKFQNTSISRMSMSQTKKPRVISTLCTSFLLFSLMSPMNCIAQTFTKKDLQQIYTENLTKEGFRPTISPKGNIIFKREGRTYAIYLDPEDPLFFQIGLGVSADDKSPEMRRKRLEAVNFASHETKVTKAYIDTEGYPFFSSEIYILNPKDAITYTERLLDGIDYAYAKYVKKLNEISK